ncbi:hypothetical protein [Granulicella mallensis]|uniref:Uncharacterized protein n=1 Tax=Granulicella mallensis TaxID=940614 RepID=A0A7W7ZU71_9BACT|nr:hypothetical protein [Granulicella mallensis]MBB5066232.1 hypothetical protein [Granulicella mallensis]
MILGMSRSTFVVVHTSLSVVAIIGGFFVVFTFLNGTLSRLWNAVFLLTTTLTSASGFLFPRTRVTPGIVLGILSVTLLCIAIVALYGFRLRSHWRRIYVISALIPFYFNLVVLLAIMFARISVLQMLASATRGAAFSIAQVLLLILAIGVIAIAVKKFCLTPSSDLWKWNRVEGLPRDAGGS